MDNEMLEVLKRLESKLDYNTQELKRLESKFDDNTQELKNVNTKVDRIEKKLDSVHDQTANLTEFRTETKEGIETIKKDISKLTNVTKTNCFEIADLKAVK